MYVPKLTHLERRERRREMVAMVADGKSVVEIAAKFKVKPFTVYYAMEEAQLGYPEHQETSKRRMVRERTERISKMVDKGKTRKEICKAVKIHPTNLQNVLNRLGKRPTDTRGKNTPTVFPWDTVDWSLNDSAISRKLSCTRERVRQVRIKLGKPRSVNYRKHTK